MGDGTADGKIVVRGTIADLNAALNGLQFIPTVHTSGAANLAITVDDLGNSGFEGPKTASASVPITVAAVADAPTLTVTAASGNEHAAIPLNVASALVDTDGSETLSITVGGLPAGAVLSSGTDLGGGKWRLTPAQLNGLTITPPSHRHGVFSLTVTATSKETSNGSTASTVQPLTLTVAAVADAPTLTVTAASGNEHAAIPLNVASALVDTDGSETLSITVGGLPAGAVLSSGTDLGGGKWRLTPAQLNGLTVISPVSGNFPLSVTATSKETSNGSTATTVRPLMLSLNSITPKVAGLFDMPVYQNVPTSINLGRFSTPGTSGPWKVGIDWGDSSPLTSFTMATPGDLGVRSHTCDSTGNHTVTVMVTDTYGHVGSSQFTVNVLGYAQMPVFRPSSSTWHIRDTSGQVLVDNQQWGLPGDIPVSADFNGDDTTDMAVFRPSNGQWYIRTMAGQVLMNGQQWGLSGDIPSAGDFNGDGQADLAVFRPSNGQWYVRTMAGQVLMNGQQWGLSGDKPEVGDFNRDGTTDLAVFRPSNGQWYVRTMAGQVLMNGQQWGLSGDIPETGDFDGDGTTDLAVFRPSDNQWYVRTMAGQVLMNGQQWGLSGDIPSAGDFNGDGQADLTVFRPSNGQWYVRTMAGQVLMNGQQWGLPDDIPMTATSSQIADRVYGSGSLPLGGPSVANATFVNGNTLSRASVVPGPGSLDYFVNQQGRRDRRGVLSLNR